MSEKQPSPLRNLIVGDRSQRREIKGGYYVTLLGDDLVAALENIFSDIPIGSIPAWHIPVGYQGHPFERVDVPLYSEVLNLPRLRLYVDPDNSAITYALCCEGESGVYDEWGKAYKVPSCGTKKADGEYLNQLIGAQNTLAEGCAVEISPKGHVVFGRSDQGDLTDGIKMLELVPWKGRTVHGSVIICPPQTPTTTGLA